MPRKAARKKLTTSDEVMPFCIVWKIARVYFEAAIEMLSQIGASLLEEESKIGGSEWVSICPTSILKLLSDPVKN
jgi:hypothetical protein